MKVIAGTAKGRNLIAPEGLDTRPVTSKIKEALFSSWQFLIPGADFLDLFAGSGSMGIEALSRGAANVVFVEKSKRAVEVIKKNLSVCKFTEGFQICQDDVFDRLRMLHNSGSSFDLIYLDPPFTVEEIFLPVMETLAEADILKEDGIIGIRTPKEMDMPDAFGKLHKFKKKKYGISTIHFYSSDLL